MHSPFVFDFILHVLNNRRKYAAPKEVEALREQWKRSSEVLEINDLGAGSRVATSNQKTVGQIAQAALKPRKYAQLLFRLVKHYQPQTVFELGTSLGLTTAYLAAANPDATITTIEGSESIVQKAKEGWRQLGCTNIRSITGNFDDVLPDILPSLPALDLVYIDGNHRYEPTVRYFQQILPYLHEYSIVVFDDIHWSPEMEQAWEAIKRHPQVQYTIDIFFLGFVFFRKEFKVKQHFSIRF
jgi:predicted O-methyltransferase YrrM